MYCCGGCDMRHNPDKEELFSVLLREFYQRCLYFGILCIQIQAILPWILAKISSKHPKLVLVRTRDVPLQIIKTRERPLCSHFWPNRLNKKVKKPSPFLIITITMAWFLATHTKIAAVEYARARRKPFSFRRSDHAHGFSLLVRPVLAKGSLICHLPMLLPTQF